MWAEFQGQVIWLERESVDDALVTNCSDQELGMIEAARSRASGDRQQQKPLVEMQAQEGFNDETGKEWHAGTRVRGRVKVTKAAREEALMIKGKA